MENQRDSEELEGTQEVPTSEGSGQGSGQQNSKADVVTKKEYDELQKKLDLLARQIQGDKDRAVKKVEQRLDKLDGDIRTILQGAAKNGQSVNDLLAQIEQDEERETRELLRELALGVKSGSLSRLGEQGSSQGSEVKASEIVAELELDGEDLRVRNFATRQFSSKDEAYREAAKLLKTIQTKQPSDADRSSDENKRKTFATQQERLLSEYKEGSKNLRGMALVKFKSEMRKKGLDIS